MNFGHLSTIVCTDELFSMANMLSHIYNHEHTLICTYPWNNILDKEKQKKKVDTQHYWEIMLHYSRVYHIYAIFVERLDKLINWSLL